MGRPLFGRSRGWGERLAAATFATSPIVHRIEDRVFRIITSKRRLLALSIVANIVLASLLAFRGAPQPSLRSAAALRGECLEPQPMQERASADGSGVVTTDVATAAAAASDIPEPLPMPAAGRRAWLAIGIPSAPRQGTQTDYLGPTLESLVAELPSDPTDPLYGRIRVIVMDTAPGANHAATRLRNRLRHLEKGDRFAEVAGVYVEVVDTPGDVPDPDPDAPEPDDLHNPRDLPGRAVRKQTRDLISLLELARHRAAYYMFMEDDFRVCPFMLRALHYALSKTQRQVPNWLALRVSYGMNGVVLRNGDLGSLLAHLRAGIALKPPDLLWQQWAVGRQKPQELAARPLAVYRWNMLAHLGAVSTFAVRMQRPAFPGCYTEMSEAWSLHVKERYDAGRCEAVSDVSPCDWRPGRGGASPGFFRWLKRGDAAAATPADWTRFQLTWPREAAGAAPVGGEASALAVRAMGDSSGASAGGSSGSGRAGGGASRLDGSGGFGADGGGGGAGANVGLAAERGASFDGGFISSDFGSGKEANRKAALKRIAEQRMRARAGGEPPNGAFQGRGNSADSLLQTNPMSEARREAALERVAEQRKRARHHQLGHHHGVQAAAGSDAPQLQLQDSIIQDPAGSDTDLPWP